MRESRIDKGLRFHLDEQTTAYMARGLSRPEAERQARINFGGPARPGPLRRAARCGAGRSSKVCGAIGIAANSAIFAVVNAVLLKPLPYANSDRMRTMTDVRREPVAERPFVVLLVSGFGLLALLLAAVGMDGVAWTE
ncbi:MAG: hypothetical protein GEU82_16490 [Luteitalea sp.]|nr:hypothetical protein [Luteitalea sp.]